MLGGLPGIADLGAGYGQFNRDRQLQMHPLKQFYAELVEEWNMYCNIFKECGDDREPPPYMYDLKWIEDFVVEQDAAGLENQMRQMGMSS